MTNNYDNPSIDAALEEILDDLPDNRIFVIVRGEDWGAISHPNIHENKRMGSAAPFGFKTVGSPPDEHEVTKKLGEKFKRRVTEVFQKMDTEGF